MKYKVHFNRSAIRDIEISYEWGVANWGSGQAVKWLKGLYEVVQERLSEFPLSCPAAPESREGEVEIRHLLYFRYRILFTIQDNEVRVLHLRGPYRDG